MVNVMYKNVDIRVLVEKTLGALYQLARAHVKSGWKAMAWKDRQAAVRSLAKLKAIADNPWMYFSYENTNRDWVARAHKWAREHGVAEVNHAYYIVDRPEDIALAGVWDALVGNSDLQRMLFYFCENVVMWEYEKKKKYGGLSDFYADKLIADGQKICAMAQLQQKRENMNPIKVIRRMFQK